MTYGLPYMGSKSSIADWVLAHLPVADTFVDLFAGGCSVTHAALLSGRYHHVIANDVQGDVPALFRDALQGILPPDYLHAITREEFHIRKASSPYIRLVWSFGNNARNYIFGEDVERIKLLAHSMLCEDSLSERHRMYGAFYSALVDLLRARPDDNRAESIESIDRIKRILSLRSPALAERLTVSAVSYNEVCPPPRQIQWFTQIRRIAEPRGMLSRSTSIVSIPGCAPRRSRSTSASTPCRPTSFVSPVRRRIVRCHSLPTNAPRPNASFCTNAGPLASLLNRSSPYDL